MSTLWTPGGERPVPRTPPPPPAGSAPPPSGSGPPPAGSGRPPDSGDVDEKQRREDIEAPRQQPAETPAELVIANHGFGLFELAALHLSLQPPQLEEARLAIDALGALVEGMEGRLGEQETTLREGLAQLRLAFVQIQSATSPPG